MAEDIMDVVDGRAVLNIIPRCFDYSGESLR